MPHNHRPQCCCQHHPDDIRPDGRPFARTIHPLTRCPSCVEHGDLATGGRCPRCHQEPDRPHTEYCPDGPGVVR